MIYTLTLLAALGCGLIGGLFFAFSTFVMRALARLSPGEGIAAMQSINTTILRSLFIPVFFGTAAACLAALIYALWRWDEPDAQYQLAGAVLYLAGNILVTIFFNVPRNDALAAIRPSAPEAESIWRGYVRSWTAWNHVRTVTALAAALCFSLALGK